MAKFCWRGRALKRAAARVIASLKCKYGFQLDLPRSKFTLLALLEPVNSLLRKTVTVSQMETSPILITSVKRVERSLPKLPSRYQRLILHAVQIRD